MNAIIYRRSTALSQQWLDDPDSSCSEYAREHALTITGFFYDIGRTGDGPASMLEPVQQEGVTAVIVNDIARLGEKINDHLATIRRLHDAGVTIHVAQEKIMGTQGALLLGTCRPTPQPTNSSASMSTAPDPFWRRHEGPALTIESRAYPSARGALPPSLCGPHPSRASYVTTHCLTIAEERSVAS